MVFTNFLVPQGTAILWHKNPEYHERRNPTNRLLTISEYRRHGGREWIVLPQEIRVIDRHHSVGADDPIAAVVPLSESNRRKITEAIAGIPASIRGHEYTSGAMDGIGLHFAFAADGRRQRDDIRLSNTWREELGPLIDAVSDCVSANDAIGFKAAITQDRFYDPKQQSSFTWAELDAREKRWMPLPWWCVWPRLLKG